MRFPTSAQFARLATLGVTDAERALLAQRGHDHPYLQELIRSAARWPLGSGGLRHYRLFHEFPRGARDIGQLATPDADAITAWRHLESIRPTLEAVFITAAWGRLPALAELADGLADIARDGYADAARNGAIEQRIEESTVLLAGLIAAARADGRLGGHDFATYAAPLPERLRRSGREWRALGRRQHEAALRRLRARRRALGWW